MKRLGLNLTAALLCFTAGLLAAATWGFVAPRQGAAVHPADGSQNTFSPPGPAESPIRRVDFLNFTYPNDECAICRCPKTFTLVNGELKYDGHYWVNDVWHTDVTYMDLTGDGAEEAVITLRARNSASGGDRFLYVYTMAGGKPEFLWLFPTYAGGYNDGALRDFYVKNGDLVIELYGRNAKRPDGSAISLGNDCSDCLANFTRVRLHWDGKRFRRKRVFENHPLPGKQD